MAAVAQQAGHEAERHPGEEGRRRRLARSFETRFFGPAHGGMRPLRAESVEQGHQGQECKREQPQIAAQGTGNSGELPPPTGEGEAKQIGKRGVK
jgi:hypothetical protein